MILADNISKTFTTGSTGTVKALDDVTLFVEPGEFVAVVGPSGSGKSSLLFTLGGISAPTSGRVRIANTDVYSLGPSERAALRRVDVGFVFQTFNLIPWLNVIDNVAFPAMLAGRSRREARVQAMIMLEQLGMVSRARHLPSQLSVGERQRVGIGRALVNKPKVLLADEPTGSLDAGNATQVLDLLSDFNARGQTVVVVTHSSALAERAHRIVSIVAGRVFEERQGPLRRLAS
jgi:putative ABC transport system ATP-binding protein